ncbi:MAG TPA: hypothetical protein VFK05_01225 [Polyangiaceae bacterium]|nr:hypothetical protein [Polyangiaceae bacterium]
MNEAEQVARGSLQLVATGLVLSALSYALVLYTAGKEPYFAFRCCDLVLNVVLGAVLCAAFAAWAIACIRRLRARHGSAVRTLLLCACVLWTAINLLYLGNMIYGYGQDMSNPRLHPPR